MDDFDFEDHLSDSEMLDAVPEETCSAFLASPLQVVHSSHEEQAQGVKPAAPVVMNDMRSPPTASDELCDDEDRPASLHEESSAHLVQTYQHDDPKGDVGSRSYVLAKIEDIFEAMVDVLLNERGQLSVAIRTRPSSQSQQRGSASAAQAHTDSVQQLCFPGKTEKEAWRFGECGMPLVHRYSTDAAQLS